MAKRSGRKSSAQTPAPKSDKIVGSNTNKKGSATSKGASSIKLSDKTISALKTKLDDFKKKYPKKDNVSLGDLKAVYRRGSGAYSGSHRPNVSRAGWSYARTNKFLEKAAGKKVKAAYVQDDDLLKYEDGGKLPNNIKENTTYKLLVEKSKQNSSTKKENRVKMPSIPKIREFLKNIGIETFGYGNSLQVGQEKFYWGNPNANVYKFVYKIEMDSEHTYYSKNAPFFAREIIKFIDEYYNKDVRYEKGGLIAPNGKKSNLTPEQYELVRTPEFKAWFGDWENDPENASQVVDDNGEPLVVYRGMPKKRRVGNVFKYNVNLFGTKGVGGRQTNKFAFYFTDIKQVAEDYVNDITEDEGGYVVKSYFLNVRKLFKAFSKKNQYETTFKELYDLANTDGNPVYFRNYRGEIETDYKGNKKEFWNHQYEWERKYNNKFPNKNEPFVFFVDWDKTEGNQYFWRAYLQDYLKYNGLFFYETTNNAVRLKLNDDLKPKYGDEFSKTYGVFEPNQIKLADGTNTTFDESNPDIRFDEGGKLKATGDCYYAAGQLAMLNENIDYVGTPYLVHAEVKGQGKIKGISYGHAWIEDDENVYDFSNGKRNIIPKDFYYLLGGVKTNNPKKYRKYTFSEATQKMLDTGNYGCWDLDVEYLKGGLIAPNGKKSNLTPEQYELVRTPEFKAWFGDWENDPENASKVVDENGEPKIVYHGTYVETEFNIFDFYKADLGFHFGTYEQAKNRLTTKRKQEGYKSIILPYFLNIRHITEINDHTEFEYPQRYVYDLMDEKLITESEFRKNDFSNAYYKEDNKKIRDFLIEKYGNKIGFIYNNKYEGEGYSYIVLVPNQIKLADGTNTTFDESNPDIRYEEGGNLTKENLVELSKSDFNNIVELIQNSIVDKFDEDIISRIQFLRHSIHSTNVNDIFYGNTRFDNEIEEISDEIEKLNIIGNEEKIANKIRKFSCLEGCDRKFDGGHEDEDMEKDDYSEEAYSEISEEKEAINKLVENYLQQLDEVWDNYDLNNVSDIRRKKTFKPSGFLRARSILGTGVENTSKSKKFDNKINDIILEEYYKSKKDGSNLKLVKIIDNLIKKSTYKEGGDIGQEITCSNCGWEWNTEDSKGKDKYTCHKCGKINNMEKNTKAIKNEKPDYYEKYKSGNYLANGGLTDDEGKLIDLKVGNNVIKYKRPNSNQPKQQIGGIGKISKITGTMANVVFEPNNYEVWIPLKDLKKSDTKMVDGGYLKKGGQLNPDDKSTKDFYAHISGNAGGMLVGKRHSEGGIKAVNKSTGQPLEMEGGETVITRDAVSDNTKREFEGEMLTNRQILSKINVSGGGVSFADGGDVPHKCACSGKQYKYGGDLLPDYHIVDMLGGKHEYFDSLLPSEAFNKMFDFAPKFEDGGTVYEDGGMIRLVSKKVPSLQEYISKNIGINKGLEKKTYKDYLFSTYTIVFDKLPTMVKNGLLMGNQKLVDKYING